MSPMPPLSLYIHIPFCIRKCPYCGFFSVERNEWDIPRYVEALLSETARDKGARFTTIYIGGGTPTCLDKEELRMLMEGIACVHLLDSVKEYTAEANPGTLDAEKLDILLEHGVCRISIGCQSFSDDILGFLGRIHSSRANRNAVDKARAAGFSDISIDIIYGIPGQTAEEAVRDAEEACRLEPGHISCYQLSAEPGTRLYRGVQKGKYTLPDEDTVCSMDMRLQEVFETNGFMRYEVSNYARAGYKSLHNTLCWKGYEYAGAGAGAVSMREGVRKKRVEDVSLYTESAPDRPEMFEYSEQISGPVRCRELFMTGLRMAQGIPDSRFFEQTGVPLSDYTEVFEPLASAGYVEYSKERVKCTRKGLRVLNEILMELF